MLCDVALLTTNCMLHVPEGMRYVCIQEHKEVRRGPGSPRTDVIDSGKLS